MVDAQHPRIKQLNTIVQHEIGLTVFESRLINRLQQDLPLTSRPFKQVAKQLDCSEGEVLSSLESLLSRGVLTRFGPLFNIAKAQGSYSLCALKVPPSRFEEVTDLVNQYQQVAHNYQREHIYNMWFVLAAESEAAVEGVFLDICKTTACEGINCPKQKEFFVGLYLPAIAAESTK